MNSITSINNNHKSLALFSFAKIKKSLFKTCQKFIYLPFIVGSYMKPQRYYNSHFLRTKIAPSMKISFSLKDDKKLSSNLSKHAIISTMSIIVLLYVKNYYFNTFSSSQNHINDNVISMNGNNIPHHFNHFKILDTIKTYYLIPLSIGVVGAFMGLFNFFKSLWFMSSKTPQVSISSSKKKIKLEYENAYQNKTMCHPCTRPDLPSCDRCPLHLGF